MQEIRYLRTDSHNADFQVLVRLLDAHLTSINGEDDAFYAQFNGIQYLHHVVVAYSNDAPLGCGALKEFRDEQHPHGAVEIKRMYVKGNERGHGIAQGVLQELEHWAKEEH
jgi:putative acetyltransferase